MKIMGLDCSSTSSGWCCFDDGKLVDYGCIKAKGEWNDRILAQVPELVKVIKKHHPDKIVMEDVPLKKTGGMKTLVILGAVHGMVLSIASSFKIPIQFISPNGWRSKAGLFDGTTEGKKRAVLKQKAVERANEEFGLELKWKGASSIYSEDDIAEAILICATMSGIL